MNEPRDKQLQLQPHFNCHKFTPGIKQVLPGILFLQIFPHGVQLYVG